MHKQLYDYMEREQLICKVQHGFRKCVNCTNTAVIEITRELFDDIKENVI